MRDCLVKHEENMYFFFKYRNNGCKEQPLPLALRVPKEEPTSPTQDSEEGTWMVHWMAEKSLGYCKGGAYWKSALEYLPEILPVGASESHSQKGVWWRGLSHESA